MYDVRQRADVPDVDVQIALGVRIPMRDGLALAGNLYRSRARTTPSAAIVTMTPYTAQFHHEAAMFFAAHGFAFLAVDIRGRGNSDGGLSIGCEVDDGYDVVEWAAAQDFCNGKVAMWGGSYAGYAQWRVAQSAPPHLETILPVAAPWRGLDSPMRNNIFACDRMAWLAFLHGRTAQERVFADQAHWTGHYRRWFEKGLPFATLDAETGTPSEDFQHWIPHPDLDDYWRALNPDANGYARIECPILTVTGAYDADQHGALAHYRRHMELAAPAARDRHYCVIGPWDHSGTRRPQAQVGGLPLGPASLIDMAQLDLDWFHWTMGEGPRPAFLRDRVAYYVTGAEEWRYAGELDAVSRGATPLYLAPSDAVDDRLVTGALCSGTALAESWCSYVYDPRDTLDASLEAQIDPSSVTDQRMLLARAGKQLVYDGAPLSAALDVAGWFVLEAWLAIDSPDTDFQVTVYEVDGNGDIVLLSRDIMRARYREDLGAAVLIENSDPRLYRFDGFAFVARRIAAGHRLRLVIGPINSIYLQKNYNSGKDVSHETMADARPVTVRLLHGPAWRSALHVPLAVSP